MRKNVTRALALAVSAVMLMTACGGGSTTSTTAAPAAPAATQAAETKAEETKPAETVSDTNKAVVNTAGEATTGTGEKADKDTLVYVINMEPTTLDPIGAAMSDNYTKMLSIQIYDQLLREKVGDRTTLEPVLCEGYEFSDDGLELTFEIKQGVKFHNGAEMTAEDVAFSINRALESPNVSGTAGMMKNAEVVDDTHVKVNMEYAYAPVLNLFVHTAFSILNKEYVEKCEADGTNMGRNPIGTGAYKFVSWQNGSNIKLTKNEEWHMGDVAIPNVEFSFMADATTGAIALEAGDCDVFYGVDSADLPRLRENPDVDVLSVQSSGYYFIACNTEAGALSDVRVRQAIAKAVNRQEIIDGGQDGVGWVTEVPITPGIFGYLEDFRAFEQDIEGAKALLAEAGYADGLTLSMKCPETSYYARPAQVIQEELRQVGITVELTPMERGAFTTDVTNRDYELIYNWVGAQFPDADTIVSLIFNKDLAHEGSTTNMALINDDKAQELWQAGRVALDPQERLDIYRELCELNKEQSWYIPILTSTNSICARSYVGGCYGHASCYYHVSDWSF